MRRILVTGAAIVAASLIGGGAANAQGVVSCSTFNQVSGPAKTAIVQDIVKTMNLTPPTAPIAGGDNSDATGHVPGTATVSDGCLNSPTMTVNDIVAQVMSTGHPTFQGGMQPSEETQLD